MRKAHSIFFDKKYWNKDKVLKYLNKNKIEPDKNVRKEISNVSKYYIVRLKNPAVIKNNSKYRLLKPGKGIKIIAKY
jgi:hypothetical protein